MSCSPALGLIPARAGRTDRIPFGTRFAAAHPRSRGADRCSIQTGTPEWGSSPLARGGHRVPRGSVAWPGLIPARAGRTCCMTGSHLGHGAHPRSRGADREHGTILSRSQGSSPLARGGPEYMSVCPTREGLIPARAGRTCVGSWLVGVGGAHPRSRGADTVCTGQLSTTSGSSPLARGGPREWLGVTGEWRLIPARAGRTRRHAPSSALSSAHPRSRGADTGDAPSYGGWTGSSPLARGGPPRIRAYAETRWLIPARAGRTLELSENRFIAEAHPRSRGADCRLTLTRFSRSGSSPLARGGPEADWRDAGSFRLIPARAGRTGYPVHEINTEWAHPRSRGADTGVLLHVRTDQGSSPLARGGLFAYCSVFIVGRLIPARAGRTCGGSTVRLAARAHPRSRGADVICEPPNGAQVGSSPLARGGHNLGALTHGECRLIPARAGRTFSEGSVFAHWLAHPRSRGADVLGVVPVGCFLGSSPLARGGLVPGSVLRADRRLIPARAGRTLSTHPNPPSTGAHPRSRGADERQLMDIVNRSGSSPLARGGLETDRDLPWRPRLIPARAGRTTAHRRNTPHG